MPAPLGSRQFVIGTCLGRGGFGEVYRATLVSVGGLSTEVAIKVLRPDLGPAEQAVQRLRDEGRLLARLDHPSILRVLDLLVIDGSAALVTEFVDGADLGACLEARSPLSRKGLLQAVAAVAGALDAAYNTPGPQHAPLRLVHRDIKPSNIRISRHGQVKLLDFGIARAEDVEREARTATNLLIGSPGYMAPERFVDPNPLAESDIFALGCVLYEGIVGERFFRNVTMPVLTGLAFDAQRYANYLDERLRLADGRASGPLLAAVRAMLAHTPEDRPTAAEVVRRCEELAESAPGLSVGRWARERVWPDEATTEAGSWTGRTVYDGGALAADPFADEPSMPPDAVTDEADREVWPLRAVRKMGLGFGLVGIAVGAAAGLFVVVAGAVWIGWSRSPASASALPERIPIEVAPGEASKVWLERNQRRYALPADVPEGTFKIVAQFGDAEPVGVGAATIVSGQPLIVRCSAAGTPCAAAPSSAPASGTSATER